MFRLFLASPAKHSIKKLPKGVRAKLEGCLAQIASDPFSAGEVLTGQLSGARSFHFQCEGVAYRAAYRINASINSVEILLISTRETFYNRVKQAIH